MEPTLQYDSPDLSLPDDTCAGHLFRLSKDVSVPLPQVVHISAQQRLDIGRLPSCQVILDSKKVPQMISRLHASISQEPDGTWKISDNKSVNGLCVNDTKVTEAILKDGDRIVFGGAGGKPTGARVVQPTSEFFYVFKLRGPSAKRSADTDGAHALKRSRTEELEKAEKAKQDLIEQFASERLRLVEELKHTESDLTAQLERRRKEEEDRLEKTRLALENQIKEKELSISKTLAEEKDQHTRELQTLKAELETNSNELQRHREALTELEEAKAKIKADAEEWQAKLSLASTKATEIEELKRKVEEELQKTKSVLSDVTKNSLKKSEFEEELRCAICQEWFVEAMALACSHVFCSSCIETWLAQKKTACPLCRQPMKQLPVRARMIDNLVEKMIALEPESIEAKTFKQRKAFRAKEEADLRVLREHIEKAKRSHAKFLSIADRWDKEAQKTFFDGLRHFSLGRARIEYCALVGLTTDYITFGADLARLRIASDNLNLLATDEVLVLPSFPATQIEMYRKAILEFLQRS